MPAPSASRPATTARNAAMPDRPVTVSEAPTRTSTAVAAASPILSANRALSEFTKIESPQRWVSLGACQPGGTPIRRGPRRVCISPPKLRGQHQMTVSELLRVADHLDPKGQEMVRKAYERAASAHTGQHRLSGEDYVNHPLEVAAILADLELDAETISAALLHDTVEDTALTADEVEREFGPEVARLVDGVTKLGRIALRSDQQQQAENIRKMMVAMAEDLRVVLIKLADRLHNMRTLDPLPEVKRRKISRETLDIYAPLAHRLGIGQIKWELEDLAFRNLEPEAYEDVVRRIARKRHERETLVSDLRPGVGESRHHRGDHRPPQAHLLRVAEDDPREQGLLRDLRPLSDARARRVGARLLRSARRRSLAVEAGPGALQGLRRNAEVKRLPVAPHHRNHTYGRADRDSDPNARDAPHGGVRCRRALDLQGRREGRELRPEAVVASQPARVAERGGGRRGCPGA